MSDNINDKSRTKTIAFLTAHYAAARGGQTFRLTQELRETAKIVELVNRLTKCDEVIISAEFNREPDCGPLEQLRQSHFATVSGRTNRNICLDIFFVLE